MQASSQCRLPHLEHLDPSDWSDLGDIKDVVNNELLSLLNLQSLEGEGELRQLRPLVSPIHIMLLTSRGLMGQWWVVGTTISRCIFQRCTSKRIKLEGLLGWWIHMGMSWSPHLNLTMQYGLSNGPLILLNCH